MQPQNHTAGPLDNQLDNLGKRIKMLEETLAQLKTLDSTLHEIQFILYSYVEKTKEGVVLLQDEIVVWANQAACDMLGYISEEVVNKSAVDLVHPKYRKQLSARFAMVQAGDEIPAGVLWPFISKTREIKYVRPFSYRVMYMGRPAVMAFFYDVTADKKLQDDLAMRAELLELVNELVFVLDVRGNIIYVNRAMHESLGYTRDEMVGRSILDFHTKDHQERVKLRLKLATPTSQGKYKTVYVGKNGIMVTASSSGKVINLNGTQYILGVARPLDPQDAPI
ncbi:MAG: PAS domain-containing protein [Chloroflexi bacterium]|nr:PAS domain-containing protein [Chloroflexota bacterium]